MRIRRLLWGLLALAVVGFIAIQFFPIQMIFSSMARETDLPPSQPIDWSSAEVEQLVRNSCYDCHSNEVNYPWYAHVAPVSWVINYDVNNGRAVLNFSEDDFSELYADDLLWHLENNMPTAPYLILHPDARLSPEEQQVVYEGIITSLSIQEGSNPEMDMDMGSDADDTDGDA